jgi:mediator of RNA polymerase II transcription subunit 5
MLSPKLPRPVLTLCGPSVVRLLWEGARVSQPFDVAALRLEVAKAMGVTLAGSVSLSRSKTSRSPESVEPNVNSPSLHWVDQPRRAVQNALTLIQSGKPPSLNVAACLVETPVTEFLHTLWLELNMFIERGMIADAAKRLATFVLATPRAPRTPPLLPIFLHNILPSLIDKFDNPNLGQALVGDIELLIAIISSSLMAALQLERALYTTSGQQVYPLGSSSSSMARKVALDLRHRKGSSKGKLIAQRLTSSQTFVTSFPMFKTEI